MNGPLYYDWHGTLCEVEVFDNTDRAESWDVSSFYPEHHDGAIPPGECHYLVRPVVTSGNAGWWATDDAFQRYAEPVGPGALQREGEW